MVEEEKKEISQPIAAPVTESPSDETKQLLVEDKISTLLLQVNRELKQEINALSAQLQQFIEEK